MTDTLILFKPLAEFGEALKKECPNNDCVIYRNIYERYCEEYADYKRIKKRSRTYPKRRCGRLNTRSAQAKKSFIQCGSRITPF